MRTSIHPHLLEYIFGHLTFNAQFLGSCCYQFPPRLRQQPLAFTRVYLNTSISAFSTFPPPVYLFLTAYSLAELGVGLLYLVFLRTSTKILEHTSKLAWNVSFHVHSNSLFTIIP